MHSRLVHVIGMHPLIHRSGTADHAGGVHGRYVSGTD